MKIVDSSLWVEYFLENDIDQSIIDAIKDAGNLYIPIISLYEVYKKFLTIGDSEKANTFALNTTQYPPTLPSIQRLSGVEPKH